MHVAMPLSLVTVTVWTQLSTGQQVVMGTAESRNESIAVSDAGTQWKVGRMDRFEC